MKTLNVNLDLVKKYNVAGPRYTSYPPATKFTDGVTWDDLSTRLDANNQVARDLSVYFHIPFCETLCWFCGCTTVITLNHDKGRDYIDYLGREVAQMAAKLNPARKVVQLHFGGGSPTFLRPDEIRRLGDIIHKHFTFSPDIEASVEVDPRRLTREHMVALREVGFNRASMGVQDFNPQVQEAIHRIQHLGVEILHTHRGTIKTDLPQCHHVFACEPARIHFHACFDVGRECEVLVDDLAEAADFVGLEERGRAAAEMELHDFPALVQTRREFGDFASEVINVVLALVVIERDDGGTPAEPAKRLAERDVEVERQAALGLVVRDDAFTQCVPRRIRPRPSSRTA